MSFLQPLLLAGLPLVALPILIHLINQHRHRTMKWAAMMFLLDARRMTRGIARLRYLLIMLMRMLAIAGLVFAISRPLASGWLGITGGSPDTILVLLDRSASMEQQSGTSGESKRETALRKMVELLRDIGQNTHLVLVESTLNQAQRLESADALLDLPSTAPTAASSDIAAMLQTALEYVTANEVGRTDIWICSDLREGDWNPEAGRWAAIREGFGPLQGIRFYLLSYPEQSAENLRIEVAGVRRRELDGQVELLMDVSIKRAAGSTNSLKFPLQFVVNGARSVRDVEMADSEFLLQGHSIPLDRKTEQGWGVVELPTDSNPQDNRACFVFAQPPPRHTYVISDDRAVARPLEFAAAAPSDPSIPMNATILPASQLANIDWQNSSMIIWHGALPTGAIAGQLESFIASGRTVLFLPPENPNGDRFLGFQWEQWNEATGNEPFRLGWWREDADLLANTQSGSSLPLGELRTFRYCALQGDGTVLARFENGDALLNRATADQGGVYFITTLPESSHSSLARDGVAFYVLIQRALASGAEALGSVRHWSTGEEHRDAAMKWSPLDPGLRSILPSERAFHSGVYQTSNRLVALNRPAQEDRDRVIDSPTLDQVFGGLDYRRIDDEAGNAVALANEIWRTFVIVMALALILEAILCLPSRTNKSNRELQQA